jgi:hypothetical protein
VADHAPQFREQALAVRNTLEPILQGARIFILRVIVFGLAAFGAVLPAERFRAHVGHLQAGFERALEMVQLLRQVEDRRRSVRLELKFLGIVVRRFLVGHLAGTLHRDGDIGGIRTRKGLGVNHPRRVGRQCHHRGREKQGDSHPATLIALAGRRFGSARFVA